MEINLAPPLPSGAWHLTQTFGDNPALYARWKMAGHNGIDYGVVVGTPVFAAHEGIAVVGDDPPGYGTYVKVVSGTLITLYGHLSEVIVKDGDRVDPGQQIAESGNTGNTTGPHLHFELRFVRGKNPAYLGRVDPAPFLP